MSTSQLNSLLAKTNDAVGKLEKELAASTQQQEESLAKMQELFDQSMNRSIENQADFDKNSSDHAEEMQMQQDAMMASEQNATALASQASEERQKMETLSSRLRSALHAAFRCKQKCPGLSLAVSLSVASQSWQMNEESGEAVVVSQQASPGVEHELLVRKVEAAEETLAQLQDDRQTRLVDYTEAQRRLLTRFEALKVTHAVQNAENMNTKHFLSKKDERMGWHSKAVDQYQKHQSDNLARQQQSVSALTDKLKGLEDTMGRCGCSR